MKILAIRGKNLASLDGEFVIDFTEEPLLSAGIFAITGTTGAGKSTLLDAVCLALFGQIPRLISAQQGVELKDADKNMVSQNDVRTILRKGTADGYAEVDFVVRGNEAYRSRWSVRRARYKAENQLQADHVELMKLPSLEMFGGKKKETLDRIGDLIGLNFEQFTRSVLLAQNDFTAFLKADKNEKASLLERLTGTDIYSKISKNVYERWKQTDEDLRVSQRQAEGILLLSDEELKNIERQRSEVEKELEILSGKIDLIKNSLKWFEESKTLSEWKIKAEEYLSEIRNKSEEFVPVQLLLQRIDRVQAVKEIYTGRSSAIRSIEECDRELAGLNGKIQVFESELNDVLEQKNAVVETLNIVLKEREDARPLFERAGKLDIQLENINQLLADVGEELNGLHRKTKEVQKNKEDNEKEIDENKSEAEEIRRWLQSNESWKPIAENIATIIFNLKEAADRWAKQSDLEEKISFLTTNIQQLKLNVEETSSIINEKRHLLSIDKKESADIETARANLNPDDLFVRKEYLQKRQTDLFMAAEILKKYLFSQTKYNDCLQKRGDYLRQQMETEHKIKLLKKEFFQVDAKLEQTAKLLDAAKLSVFKDITDIRAQLVENVPCPVCGSLEHPYAGQTDQLRKVFEELEHELATCKKRYDQLQKETAKTEQEEDTIRKLLQAVDIEMVSIENDLQTGDLEWKSSVLYEECKDLSGESAGDYIGAKSEKMSQELVLLGQKENDYRILSDSLNEKRKKIGILSDEIADLERELSEYRRKSDVEHQQLVNFLSDKEENDGRFDRLVETLTVYFQNGDWLDNWKKNPAGFLDKAVGFSESWKNKNDRLVQKEHALITGNKLNINLTGQYSDALHAEKINSNKLNVLRSEKDELYRMRMAIFDGKSVKETEETLNLRISNLEDQLDIVRNRENEIKASLQNISGNKQNVEKQHLELRLKEQNFFDQLQCFIADYNRNEEETLSFELLEQLLSYPPEQINEKRRNIQQVRDMLIQAESAYEERCKQLTEHLSNKLSGNSWEELVSIRAESEQSFQKLEETKLNLVFKLRQNKENERKYREVSENIQKKSEINERWAKLNVLIGSADGKKFRQIAQEYTLDTLLIYADIHLKDLTHRYRIERVPETLSIQVIDQDMGDEVRSVHSLSGGESFLVSLALALGLASLSSDRIKIESLFIDEGFGSLDPETLRVAMDALDRLHTQGRKVGVISHVQEMTERIPVQIAVEKTAPGKSRIQIRC